MLRIALISSLALLFSISSSATFVPVPLEKGHSIRLVLDPTLRTDFENVSRFEISADFMQRIGAGFEWGASLHGGAASSQLFVEGVSPVGVLGLELMGRYMGSITDILSMGLQIETGYSRNLAVSKDEIAMRLSVPFSAHYQNSVSVFGSPGIQFEGSVLDIGATPASTFGKSLGVNLHLGMVLHTQGPGVLISAKPAFRDIRDASSFYSDFSLGLVFDI